MNVRIHPFGEDVKNTGRRSRPVMLDLGVRRPVGAEPEAQVNALYWRPRSCRIYSPASSCSTSSRPCDVVVTSPQVRLRLTSGYHKLDGYAARGAYIHSLNYTLVFCGHFFIVSSLVLCLIGRMGGDAPVAGGMDEKRAAFLNQERRHACYFSSGLCD